MNAYPNRWPLYVLSVLALWLVVAPFILSYYEVVPALASDIGAGVALGVLAWGRLFRFGAWAGWLGLLLGAYLLFSPFFLGYASLVHAYMNNVVVGLLLLGAWSWNLFHPFEERGEGGPSLHPRFNSATPEDEERRS